MSNSTKNTTVVDVGEMNARQALTMVVVAPILTIALGAVPLVYILKKEGPKYQQMKWMVVNIAAVIILKGAVYPVTNNSFVEITLEGNLCNFVSFLYQFCHVHGQIAVFILLLNGYIFIVCPEKHAEVVTEKVILGAVMSSIFIDMIIAGILAVVIQSSLWCKPTYLGNAVYGVLPPSLNMAIAALALFYIMFNGKKFMSQEYRMQKKQQFDLVFGIGCYAATLVFVSQLVAFNLAIHNSKWRALLIEILYILYYILVPIFIISKLPKLVLSQTSADAPINSNSLENQAPQWSGQAMSTTNQNAPPPAENQSYFNQAFSTPTDYSSFNTANSGTPAPPTYFESVNNTTYGGSYVSNKAYPATKTLYS